MVEFGKSKSGEPLHPGRILLTQAMEPLGISRNQLARDIDVPVGRISDITNGKRGITADTALRLGRYFGTGPELWMRLQAEFDLYVARMTTWPSVEPRVRVLEAQSNKQSNNTTDAGHGRPAGIDPADDEHDLDSDDPKVAIPVPLDSERDPELTENEVKPGHSDSASEPPFGAQAADSDPAEELPGRAASGLDDNLQNDDAQTADPSAFPASSGDDDQGALPRAPVADRAMNDIVAEDEEDLGIPPVPGHSAIASSS